MEKPDGTLFGDRAPFVRENHRSGSGTSTEDLHDRNTEARNSSRPGEVAGLKVGLGPATFKSAGLDRTVRRAATERGAVRLVPDRQDDGEPRASIMLTQYVCEDSPLGYASQEYTFGARHCFLWWYTGHLNTCSVIDRRYPKSVAIQVRGYKGHPEYTLGRFLQYLDAFVHPLVVDLEDLRASPIDQEPNLEGGTRGSIGRSTLSPPERENDAAAQIKDRVAAAEHFGLHSEQFTVERCRRGGIADVNQELIGETHELPFARGI